MRIPGAKSLEDDQLLVTAESVDALVTAVNDGTISAGSFLQFKSVVDADALFEGVPHTVAHWKCSVLGTTDEQGTPWIEDVNSIPADLPSWDIAKSKDFDVPIPTGTNPECPSKSSGSSSSGDSSDDGCNGVVGCVVEGGKAVAGAVAGGVGAVAGYVGGRRRNLVIGTKVPSKCTRTKTLQVRSVASELGIKIISFFDTLAELKVTEGQSAGAQFISPICKLYLFFPFFFISIFNLSQKSLHCILLLFCFIIIRFQL